MVFVYLDHRTRIPPIPPPPTPTALVLYLYPPTTIATTTSATCNQNSVFSAFRSSRWLGAMHVPVTTMLLVTSFLDPC